MTLREILAEVDDLKNRIDSLRPIDPAQEQRIMQKFRLDWNFHSQVKIGQYKTTPNSVKTNTGAIYYYASPEETPALMGELMQWFRAESEKGDLHPLIVSATFHYRFVRIHPFDDGNGRMARLLMNLILMQTGYVPVIIKLASKGAYLFALEQADAGELEDFIVLVEGELIYSMELYLRGVRGEDIEGIGDPNRYSL
jgi:Fic family protein